MSIISQETWDKFTEKEKDKVIKDYNNSAVAVRIRLEAYFGKENLQPKPKIRTWKDVVAASHNIYDKELNPNCGNTLISCITNEILKDKISLKCDATIKIAKLIELGYGGMVSNEENNDIKIKKYAPFYYGKNGFVIEYLCRSQDRVLCFHTKQQAEEFMSYPENVELVKQYNMI